MSRNIWLCFVIGLLRQTCRSANHAVHWTYGDNPTGADSWPDLFPNQCAMTHQSPVDIRTARTVYDPNLGPFSFEYGLTPSSRFYALNNGHSIKVDTEGVFSVYGGGLHNAYSTIHLHLHWGESSDFGSEHTIDGREFPLDIHIVSWNSEKYWSVQEAMQYPDGLAVLSILFEISMEDNPALQPILDAVPYIWNPNATRYIEIPTFSLSKFLPDEAHRYFRYSGSLTTPPCYESVIWTVFDRRQTVSERQVNILRHTHMFVHSEHHHTGFRHTEPMVNNFRPTQPLNGRTIYRSFPYLNDQGTRRWWWWW